MANRAFTSIFINSFNKYLTYLQGSFHIGATGAVSLATGTGITSVTRLGVGTYLIKPEDGYPRFLGASFNCAAPVTGSEVSDGSFVTGTTYRITTLGTTTAWASVGLPSAFTPALGQTFVATGVGGSGNGKAKAVSVSGVATVEIADTNVQQSTQLGVGVMIQFIDATGAVVEAASGSDCYFELRYRNSGVTGKGE